ncbi:MAG: gliding motility protein GldM [Bacteroidota bacterium]
MASGKLSPRQKMINMMYLVLIALLALNVSKEILKAFHMFELSFINANKNTDLKNADVMAIFKDNMADEKKKVKTEPFFKKAEQAQKLSKEFCDYVEKIKTDIVGNAGGRAPNKEGETGLTELAQPDNMEKHANYFIPEGGGNGKKLQDKINATRKSLLELLNDVKDGKATAASLEKSTQLRADDPKESALVKHTWVSMYLEHSPLAGVATLLTKTQNDCKALEADILATLANSIDKATIKFDKQLALIMPDATNVMSGNAFTARVALAAYNSTTNAKMLVNGAPVTVTAGIGEISIPAQGVGAHTVTAKIETMDPNTGETIYIDAEPVEWTSFLPSAAISADAMNALYIGLDNPMSISVPGVTPENTIVSAGPGISLTKTGSGKFIAKVTSVPGNKSSITVSAKIGGATKKMGEQIYKIRQVPKPVPMLGSLESGSYPKAILQAQQFLNAYLSNFVFDGVNFKVTKFSVVLASKRKGTKDVSVTGNNFAPARSLISEAAAGDMIVIEGIRAVGPGGEKLLSPLTFKIQ